MSGDRAPPLTSIAYDVPTGRLLVEGPGWSGIGTLLEWEQRMLAIRKVIVRQRIAAYGGRDRPAPPAPPRELKVAEPVGAADLLIPRK